MHKYLPILFLLFLSSTFAYAERTSGEEEQKTGLADGLKSLTSFSSAEDGQSPLLIKSDSLRVDSINRKFIYEGNVRAVRANTVITSQILIGDYDENDELKTVLCKKDVVITKGEIMRASSERALYLVPDGKIELTEGPELINDGNALTADKITIYVDDDRSEAEGDVRVRVIEKEQEKETLPGEEELLSE